LKFSNQTKKQKNKSCGRNFAEKVLSQREFLFGCQCKSCQNSKEYVELRCGGQTKLVLNFFLKKEKNNFFLLLLLASILSWSL